MKRLFLVLVLLASGFAAAVAQPRAIGIRESWQHFLPEISYQHYLGPGFLQGDLQLSWGRVLNYDADGFRRSHTGFAFLLTPTYNYIFVHPEWTRGTWDIYAGGGLSIGRMYDEGSYIYDAYGDIRFTRRQSLGFTFGAALTAGLAYRFVKVPIQLSADIRPIFGVHMCEDAYATHFVRERLDGSQVAPTVAGFYRNGMWGFLPAISVRYAF